MINTKATKRVLRPYRRKGHRASWLSPPYDRGLERPSRFCVIAGCKLTH